MHKISNARRRRQAPTTISAAVCSMLLMGAAAQADPTRISGAEHTALARLESQASFEIPPQPIATALVEFSKQAKLQLVTASVELGARQTNGVSGKLTLREALSALLERSGLSYAMVGENTVAIVASDADAEARSHHSPTGYVHLAQAHASSIDDSDVQAAAQMAGSDGSSTSLKAEDPRLEEIVVTGSHIRGVLDIAAPTSTITREELERSGFTRISDLFESLPQNFAAVKADGGPPTGGGSLAQSNRWRAASIDLRGLGPQSTLILINGTRRAGTLGGRVVDVSAIPLSMVERVEIVSGGRSATYGTDAVAGVVNVVTRKDFDGAETQVTYGSPMGHEGGERLRTSQLFGRQSERGGFVVAYDYSQDWELDLADLGMLQSTSEISYISNPVQADTKQHAAMVSGYYKMTDAIGFHADAQFVDRKFTTLELSRYSGASQDSFSVVEGTSEQFSVSPGMRIKLTGGWQAGINATIARSNDPVLVRTALHFPGDAQFSGVSLLGNETEIRSLTTVLDGLLPSMAGVTAKLALGAEIRDESLRFAQVAVGLLDARYRGDRDIWSAFGELLLPLHEADAMSGMRRLELSIAARYDEYSDVGSTVNPQLGLVWQPFDSTTVRAAYSTAFRAPDLFALRSFGQFVIQNVADPTRGGSLVPVGFVEGSAPNMRPEEADTWSIGLDYRPSFLPEMKLSLAYFSIDYDNRIELPIEHVARPLALTNAAYYPGLIHRSPTDALIAEYISTDSDGAIDNLTGRPWNPAAQPLLDAMPDLILFDARTGNLAVENLRGIDLSIDGAHGVRSGALNWGINVTYTLDHERMVTAASPAIRVLNEVGTPVDFRARGSLGWTGGSYGAHLYVNYTDNYRNPYSTPTSSMASWTTADVTLRYDASNLATTGWLDGFKVALSVTNVLDKKPPRFGDSRYGILYDTTNANPIGRYVSLHLTKAW